jgi:hypothetical protein
VINLLTNVLTGFIIPLHAALAAHGGNNMNKFGEYLLAAMFALGAAMYVIAALAVLTA